MAFGRDSGGGPHRSSQTTLKEVNNTEKKLMQRIHISYKIKVLYINTVQKTGHVLTYSGGHKEMSSILADQ
jgi:hypothetical protein